MYDEIDANPATKVLLNFIDDPTWTIYDVYSGYKHIIYDDDIYKGLGTYSSGIAEHNGFVIILGDVDTSKSGKPYIDNYMKEDYFKDNYITYGYDMRKNWRYRLSSELSECVKEISSYTKVENKIEKLLRITVERGASLQEEESAKAMIKRLESKLIVKRVSNVTPTLSSYEYPSNYPVFQEHPLGCTWHVELDGKIVACGPTLNKGNVKKIANMLREMTDINLCTKDMVPIVKRKLTEKIMCLKINDNKVKHLKLNTIYFSDSYAYGGTDYVWVSDGKRAKAFSLRYKKFLKDPYAKTCNCCNLHEGMVCKVYVPTDEYTFTTEPASKLYEIKPIPEPEEIDVSEMLGINITKDNENGDIDINKCPKELVHMLVQEGDEHLADSVWRVLPEEVKLNLIKEHM